MEQRSCSTHVHNVNEKCDWQQGTIFTEKLICNSYYPHSFEYAPSDEAGFRGSALLQDGTHRDCLEGGTNGEEDSRIRAIQS